jgi:hypothetical protein
MEPTIMTKPQRPPIMMVRSKVVNAAGILIENLQEAVGTIEGGEKRISRGHCRSSVGSSERQELNIAQLSIFAFAKVAGVGATQGRYAPP